ncbi:MULTISPECIES: copper resistance D family protein [Acinetobacter]|jgi:putative copper resistance protein D|uniref:copper resistance D family protein n=1 Tax=Acinetobacter TaxID=469 RepID=UPI00044D43D0|nr:MULTISPECIES: CopD family protein [Acinetobacter]MDQ9825285.1 CopD family protein [Acinetobacter sp. 163]SSR40920.1 copper resistance protein D [Acinetobacter baumannii]AZC08744.1 copper resistance protein CopD [Acinetobacter nosocomialis]EHU1210680.1 CopD family protein [Acinetobacter nosocomialis]EXH10773.1 copper resistance D family protein [Acinetobacter sp. 1245593]
MNPETWIYATWLIKVVLYLGIAFVVGGAFSYFLLGRYVEIKETLLKYITIGAGLGFISSTLGFFVLIGSFANTGLSGMWDNNYINILVNTPTGHIHIIRTVSFAILLLFMIVKLSKGTIQVSKVEGTIFTILLIPIVFSFSQLGHVTNLPLFAQFLLSIHVLVMSLWMGSLFPLWRTTKKITGLSLKDRMHLFGRIATFVVGILLACGASIALLLIKDFNTLLNTPYGHGFIIKIAFVLSILLLAAFNKWYFTPRLQDPKFAGQLGYAILFEMSLGLMILLTTGYITTVVGIE